MTELRSEEGRGRENVLGEGECKGLGWEGRGSAQSIERCLSIRCGWSREREVGSCCWGAGGTDKDPTILGLESSNPENNVKGSKSGFLWYYGITASNGNLPLKGV